MATITQTSLFATASIIMAWVARLVGPVSVRGRVSRLTQLVSKTLATTTTGTRYGPHVVEATTATAARGTAAGTPCCHMQPPLLQHRTVATSSAAAHAAATVEPSDDVGEVVMSEDVFHDIAGKTLDDLEMALEDLVDGITADDADLSYSVSSVTVFSVRFPVCVALTSDTDACVVAVWCAACVARKTRMECLHSRWVENMAHTSSTSKHQIDSCGGPLPSGTTLLPPLLYCTALHCMPRTTHGVQLTCACVWQQHQQWPQEVRVQRC